MSGVYTVTMPVTSVTTGPKTLVSVFSTASIVVEVLDVWITNEDVESSQQTAARLIWLTADNGTNTAATPEPIADSDAAATVSANEDYTAEPTKGNPIYRWGFNVLSGLFIVFPDRQLPRTTVGTANGVALELTTTITAANISAGMTFREVRV